MREYLFIAGQSVPAINRRLEIPPDVILGEIKAIPTLSPTLSCQVCIIFHRGCFIPPSTETCLRKNCQGLQQTWGWGGTRERGPGARLRSQGQARTWEVGAVGFPSRRNTLAAWVWVCLQGALPLEGPSGDSLAAGCGGDVLQGFFYPLCKMPINTPSGDICICFWSAGP